MPRLPGTATYGMGAPAQPTMLPSPKGIAGPVLQAVDAAEAQARLPNPLQQVSQFGAEVSQQLFSAEQKQQAKEDAIARSQARTAYFQQADQLFSDAETSDITSKAGFTALTKSLDELKQKTLESYPGSDEGRAALEMQLNDAHADYGRRAITARSKAIGAQLNGEFEATTNRLSSQAYDTPSMLSDMLKASDAWLDDTSPAMNPQETAARRADMHGAIAYSAIDGLLNRGDYREAELLANTSGAVLNPQQRSSIDRRVRGLQADAAKQQMTLAQGPDLKSVGEGVLYDPATGEMHPPPAAVQQYYQTLKESGRSSVSQNVGPGQTEYDKERDKQFAGQMKQYQDNASKSNENLATAQNVDKLLTGIPTGTFPAEIKKQFMKLTGVDETTLGNIQAAEKESAKLLAQGLQEMKLAPITDSDRRYVMSVTPGFLETPMGRKNAIYLMQREAAFNQSMSEFSQKIDKQIGTTMGRQEAQILLDKWRQNLQAQYTASFNPPGKPQ